MAKTIIQEEQFFDEESSMYDTGAERALLSAIMKDPVLMAQARLSIKPEDIFNLYNRTIYQTMVYLHNRQLRDGKDAFYDSMSMLSAAKELGRGDAFLKKVGDMEHLELIEKSPAKTESFDQYVETLRQRSDRVHTYRKAREIQREALDASRVPRREFLADVEKMILNISSDRGNQDIVKLGEMAEKFVEGCILARGTNSAGIDVGLFPQLMEVLNRVRRKQLIIVFARPKTGKSAFFLNMAIDVACHQNIPVLYLDTEMSEEEQLSRAIARWADVEEWDILDGKFADDVDKTKKVNDVVSLFNNAPFFYSAVKGLSKEELISRCRQFKTQHVGEEEINGEMKTKPCLIVYDWLKVVDGGGFGNNVKEYQELGYIATAIKNIARELDVPVVAGAQANRSGKGKDVDGTSAEYADKFLADSDRLLRFCTCLIWLRKLTESELAVVNRYDPEFYFNQMLHVVDQRQGPTCFEGIPLMYSGPKISYQECNVPEDILKEVRSANGADSKRERKYGVEDTSTNVIAQSEKGSLE